MKKTAARCWNLLNEGKPFTPIFVIGTMILFHFQGLLQGEWFPFLISLLFTLPLFILYFYYDFPLFLRNYLWIPVIGYLLFFESPNLALWGFGIGLYFFFTVFFWGTFYYHLRIGTDWLNFTRFWKLVLKNSDSTSGNAQEQLAEVPIVISSVGRNDDESVQWRIPSDHSLFHFLRSSRDHAFILHHFLFDWKPKQYDSFTTMNR